MKCPKCNTFFSQNVCQCTVCGYQITSPENQSESSQSDNNNQFNYNSQQTINNQPITNNEQHNNVPNNNLNKKSKTKNSIVGIITFIIFFSLSYYGVFNINNLIPAKDKEYSKAGMSIRLNSSFTEKELISQTVYYQSTNVIVTALKEEFLTFEALGVSTDITLEEYAELVLQNNKLNTSILTDDGLTYFIYDSSTSGKDFIHYAVVYRGKDAYWLIQFGCEQKNFDKFKKDFIKWAKTVKFY